jgi:hypothetical protein
LQQLSRSMASIQRSQTRAQMALLLASSDSAIFLS